MKNTYIGWTLGALLFMTMVLTSQSMYEQLLGRARRASWCETMEATQGWFRCKNRQAPYCIHPYLRCNGEQQCTDNSDEEGCSTEAPSAEHRSGSNMCEECSDLDRRILNLHNDLRAKENAANMNELQWSSKAAALARQWASQCREPRFGENPHGMMSPDYGQNIGRSYRSGGFYDSLVMDHIQAWYDEKGAYDFQNDKCATGSKCGHYKAITSAYIREIGCAVHHCKREMDGMKTQFYNFVCDYRPWPNWKIWLMHPKQPFIEGKHCSKCQPGLSCRNNLCA